MKIILVLLFITYALAHNWLITPVPFDGGAAFAAPTGTPCDSGTTAPTLITQTQNGGSFPATFSDNHANSEHTLWLAPTADEGSLESYTPTSPELIFYQEIAGEGAGTESTTVTWSKQVPAGSYLLQYRWNNYRNCAPLIIQAPVPSGAQAVSGQPGVYKIPHGTFNATSGTVKCDTGYSATKNNESCAMNGAAAFFLALFIVLVLVLIAVVILVVLNKSQVLPAKMSAVVTKGENVVLCKKNTTA